VATRRINFPRRTIPATYVRTKAYFIWPRRISTLIECGRPCDMNGPRHLDDAAVEWVGWDAALADRPGECGATSSQVQVAHYKLATPWEARDANGWRPKKPRNSNGLSWSVGIAGEGGVDAEGARSDL
jgi:hypothetical protein